MLMFRSNTMTMYRRIALAAISEPVGGIKIERSINRLLKQSIRWHGGPSISKDAPTISITFQNPYPASSSPEETVTVTAQVGETMLQTAQRNNIDLEGACEGVCACSTCHVILPDDIFDSLPEAEEEEEDMLDMAFGLTTTSRLGCQINVTKEMDGITVKVPSATRNFYVDGHIPQPH